jgi:RNA polymerase sigma-70 factor (ECF subfamily)
MLRGCLVRSILRAIFRFVTFQSLRSLSVIEIGDQACGGLAVRMRPKADHAEPVQEHARLHESVLPATAAPATSIQIQRTVEEELALIERVCAGETQLFYDLINPYERSVYVAAISELQNEADAEEAAQESFLKAFAHLDSFRREAKFSTWLIQIAVNVARSKRRKDRKSLYESTDEIDHEKGDSPPKGYCPKDLADWRETPMEALQRAELRRALRNAIASLNPAHRQVFVMRDIEKLSIAETAQVLQITEALVKTRLLRARLRMRDALAPGIDGAWSIGDGGWKKVRPW